MSTVALSEGMNGWSVIGQRSQRQEAVNSQQTPTMGMVQANAPGITFFALNRSSSLRPEVFSFVLLVQTRERKPRFSGPPLKGSGGNPTLRVFKIRVLFCFLVICQDLCFSHLRPEAGLVTAVKILTAHRRDEPVACCSSPGPLWRRLVSTARAGASQNVQIHRGSWEGQLAPSSFNFDAGMNCSGCEVSCG